MNRPELLVAYRGRIVVNGLAEHVEYAPEAFRSDRNLDWRACVHSLHAAHETIGRAHGDAAGYAVAKMLHDFNHEVDIYTAGLALDCDCVQDLREFPRRKFNIYDRSDDLYYFTFSQW